MFFGINIRNNQGTESKMVTTSRVKVQDYYFWRKKTSNFEWELNINTSEVTRRNISEQERRCEKDV